MNAIVRWPDAECYALIEAGRLVTAGRRPYLLAVVRCSQVAGPEGERAMSAIKAASEGVEWLGGGDDDSE